MNRLALLLAGLALALSLVSCAGTKKNFFVLVPDPEGKTGTIVVENEAGSQTITQAGYSTGVKDAITKPSEPVAMNDKEMQRIFGAALSSLPEPPIVYALYFKNASDRLTDESSGRLPSIIAAIKDRKSRYNSIDISVIGHTDTVGTKEANNILSLNRAQRVKEILITIDIDPRFIAVDFHGEDNPIIKTPDEVAEPLNRRVEVTVR